MFFASFSRFSTLQNAIILEKEHFSRLLCSFQSTVYCTCVTWCTLILHRAHLNACLPCGHMAKYKFMRMPSITYNHRRAFSTLVFIIFALRCLSIFLACIIYDCTCSKWLTHTVLDSNVQCHTHNNFRGKYFRE